MLPVRCRMRGVHGFFDHHHTPVPCEAREEMLGSLVDKVPTEMRKGDEWKR